MPRTAKPAKLRQHNEYFRTVSLNNRKSCPSCGAKLLPSESIWSWGEYVRAKWRTVKHFCIACYPEIREHLNSHTDDCGCVVNLISKGQELPVWLVLQPKDFLVLQPVDAATCENQ